MVLAEKRASTSPEAARWGERTSPLPQAAEPGAALLPPHIGSGIARS
jgi:hypothetical protein